MRAARYYEHHKVKLEDVEIPKAGSSQVLVAVEWCGICGSDLFDYLHGPIIAPPAGQPHAITGETVPLTMGHEFCGRIHSAPEGSKLKKGQGVVVDPRHYCDKCAACKNGFTNACATIGFRGLHGGGGGLSEFVAVDEHMVHAVPDDILPYAALLEPLAVASRAIRRAEIKDFSKSDFLIIGAGPIGYATALVLRAYGAKQIILSQTSMKRRKQIEPLVHTVINPREENVGERCKELTGGKGVDAAFDAAGKLQGLVAAVDGLACGGFFIHMSTWDADMIVPWFPVINKEITIRGIQSYRSEDFQEMAQLMADGKLEGYKDMVTSRIYLEDVVEKGLHELTNHKDDHLKILITPRKDNLI